MTKKFLIDNYYKLFTDGSKVGALPVGCFCKYFLSDCIRLFTYSVLVLTLETWFPSCGNRALLSMSCNLNESFALSTGVNLFATSKLSPKWWGLGRFCKAWAAFSMKNTIKNPTEKKVKYFYLHAINIFFYFMWKFQTSPASSSPW